MYEDLVKRLRYLAKVYSICENENTQEYKLAVEATDAIEELSREYESVAASLNESVELVRKLQQPRWIPVTERLPKCEQEVLICTEKKILGKNSYLDSIVTPAIYEDGTMRENDSIWSWEEIDYAGWDEEEDCGIIPEGWWENRHFNPDDVYNNPVDRRVVAWMPLPQPPKEEPK